MTRSHLPWFGTLVLLVDQSPTTRKVLARAIESAFPDTHVITVGCAEQAQLLLARHPVDVILTGAVLPGESGLELARRVRANPRTARIPVVLVTSDDSRQALEQARAAGIDTVIKKQAGTTLVVEQLATYLRAAQPHMRVLVVEDSQTAAHVVLRALQTAGYEVTHVETAEGACDRLAADPGAWDLVVTDYVLGTARGSKVIAYVRNELRLGRHELPILVLTGSTSDETQVAVFRAGATDYITKPVVPEVLRARVESLLTIRRQLQMLDERNRLLDEIASTDLLTQCASKHFLLETAYQMAGDARTYPLMCAMVDVDHFKRINDTRGHLFGDRVLAAVGATLRELCDDERTIAGRWGGEEFCVFAAGVADEAAAREFGERIRSRVEALEPEGTHITVSVGVAVLAQPRSVTEAVDLLVREADGAVYAAKGRGRNCVVGSTERHEQAASA